MTTNLVNLSGSPGDMTPPVPQPKLRAYDRSGDWEIRIYDVGSHVDRVERYHRGVVERVGQVEAYKAWTLLAHWTEDLP